MYRQCTIQNYCNDSQYKFNPTEGIEQRVFREYVKELINEYGTYNHRDGVIYLHVTDLPSRIQHDYLKNYLFDDEMTYLEEIITSPSLMSAAFEDCKVQLQTIINNYSDEVYGDFMSAKGLVCSQDSNNGEYRWDEA